MTSDGKMKRREESGQETWKEKILEKTGDESLMTLRKLKLSKYCLSHSQSPPPAAG